MDEFKIAYKEEQSLFKRLTVFGFGSFCVEYVDSLEEAETK